MPFVMFVSWCFRSMLWYELIWWFVIANPAGILITLIALGVLFRNDDTRYLFFGMGVFCVLIFLSFLPIWYQHVGQPQEPDLHWHNYWEMLHVH